MAVYPLDKPLHPDFADPGEKPIGRMEIDWGDSVNGPNELARGLKFFAVFNERYNRIQDLVTGAFYDTDTGTWSIDGKGPYLDLASTAIPITELNTAAYTKIVHVASDVTSGSQNVMSGNNSTSSFLWANGAGLWTVGHGYAVSSMLTGSAVVAGQDITLAATYNSAVTRAALYENGGEVASTASAATFSTGYLSLGSHNNNNYFDGKMRFALHFDVEKSAAEVESLSRDPYQILKPAIPINYFVSGAAIVTTAITGTMTATVDEDDITGGSKTVIGTLTGDTLKAAGTGPIGSTADTQALIDGCDAASSPANGWNNEVRDKALTSEIVRTSDTVFTWTVAAQAGYDISAQETITVTIPTDVLVTGAGAVVATPTFTIDPVATGRIMGSLAGKGGLAGPGGLAGRGGGMAG